MSYFTAQATFTVMNATSEDDARERWAKACEQCDFSSIMFSGVFEDTRRVERQIAAERKRIAERDRAEPVRRASRRLTEPAGTATQHISFECPDCGQVLSWYMTSDRTGTAGYYRMAFCANWNCRSHQAVFACASPEDRVSATPEEPEDEYPAGSGPYGV